MINPVQLLILYFIYNYFHLFRNPLTRDLFEDGLSGFSEVLREIHELLGKNFIFGFEKLAHPVLHFQH